MPRDIPVDPDTGKPIPEVTPRSPSPELPSKTGAPPGREMPLPNQPNLPRTIPGGPGGGDRDVPTSPEPGGGIRPHDPVPLPSV